MMPKAIWHTTIQGFVPGDLETGWVRVPTPTGIDLDQLVEQLRFVRIGFFLEW
jgi:hypothetical protein